MTCRIIEYKIEHKSIEGMKKFYQTSFRLIRVICMKTLLHFVIPAMRAIINETISVDDSLF